MGIPLSLFLISLLYFTVFAFGILSYTYISILFKNITVLMRKIRPLGHSNYKKKCSPPFI